MVTNKPSTTVCVACETPKPGEESKSVASGVAKPVATGSIGAGGFSFGVPTADGLDKQVGDLSLQNESAAATGGDETKE